jgi:hypothetical protein
LAGERTLPLVGTEIRYVQRKQLVGEGLVGWINKLLLHGTLISCEQMQDIGFEGLVD